MVANTFRAAGQRPSELVHPGVLSLNLPIELINFGDAGEFIEDHRLERRQEVCAQTIEVGGPDLAVVDPNPVGRNSVGQRRSQSLLQTAHTLRRDTIALAIRAEINEPLGDRAIGQILDLSDEPKDLPVLQ